MTGRRSSSAGCHVCKSPRRRERLRQIYVGVINWLLMIVTVCLTLFFGKSDNLAAAYGYSISATMLMTSALLFIAMREVWDGASS